MGTNTSGLDSIFSSNHFIFDSYTPWGIVGRVYIYIYSVCVCACFKMLEFVFPISHLKRRSSLYGYILNPTSLASRGLCRGKWESHAPRGLKGILVRIWVAWARNP